MRIGQIAPLYESVPPVYYGGTERVVHFLTEELVRQGHQVTLFASGDSETSAELVSSCEHCLRLTEGDDGRTIPHILLLEEVAARAHEFDIIHSHLSYLAFAFLRRQSTASLTTLHGKLDRSDYAPLLEEFIDLPLISISDNQRSPVTWANWLGTVYHGIPPTLYSLNEKGGDYLAFLGRISPEKRVDRAVEIARRSGMRLKVAAKIDPVDREYFGQVISPLFDDPLVEFVGEIADHEKNEFLGNAYALLFPIDWPEPFGLVMIEAMACGTPIVAFRNGSVSEVIDEGVTGLVVENVDEAVRALERVSRLSRHRCRKVFERRFTDYRMTTDYVKLYSRLLKDKFEVLPSQSAGLVS